MRRFNLLGFWMTVILTAFSATLSTAQVERVVDQVSQSSYRHFLDDLLYTHYGHNRGFGAEHDLARDNIYNHFRSLGLRTTLEPFTYSGRTYYNVVAIHPGTVRPNEIYIVGAHMDSVNNPGADDDGSGTAGVMEAARVLSNHFFEATITFIAFDREEQGLIGSQAYVQRHRNDNIQGMIQLDMIAWNSGANIAQIFGRSASNAVKQALANAITRYGNGIQPVIRGAWDASDHAPFEWAGFKAALLFETDGNPYYHTQWDSVDTPNYINYVYATNLTRSAVGYLATAAVLIHPPGDVNGDWCVNDQDLAAVLIVFGQPCSGCAEDLNNDGIVNDGDLAIVLLSFGKGC